MRPKATVPFWIALIAISGIGVAGAQDVDREQSAQSANESPVQIDARLEPAIVRLEGALAELHALEEAWLGEDERENAESMARLEELALLEAELDAAERRSPEVDTLFDRVNPVVRWAMDEVGSAIDRAWRPSELPDWAGRREADSAAVQPFGTAGDGLPASERTGRLEELAREVEKETARLKALELELRLADVERDIDLASRIYTLRLAAIRSLTFERRSEVYGWTREGREAIVLEFDALKLVVRLQWFRARGLLASASIKLRSALAALLAGRILIRILLVVLLWRWVQRGRAQFLKNLRRKAEAIDEPQQRRWTGRMVDFLEALAPWGVFIVAMVSFAWALLDERNSVPFLYPLLMIGVAYGIYRLAVDLGMGAAIGGMESSGLDMTAERRQNLLVAVRWGMRAAAVVGFVLWLYSLRLGEGVLYSWIRTVGLLFVVVVVLVVIFRFRREVREMFLALKAHGWLADLVRSTADRWTGHLVTPVAFIWLLWRGAVGLLRGLTFSFGRSRTAMAYLSRRRMSKVAEQHGFAEGRVEDLPSDLVDALDDKLSIEDLETIDGFVGLDVARASAVAWRNGAAGGSLLLAGEEGLGKAAWLERFVALEGDGTRLELGDRVLSPTKLRGCLSESLVSDGGGSLSQDELIEAICAGPRRIVILEGAENLFLATVNGYKALTELGPVIDGTRRQVFWVLTMGGLAWNHLHAAGKELSFLRRKFVLLTLSEEQIAALIDSRLAKGGFRVSYADLMGAGGRTEDEAARNKQGRQTFMNLLWDFSGGNPQIALYFFLRSIEVAQDGSLRVRPFQAPNEDRLTEVGDQALFLLAAVMRHGSLNVRQAATTTAYPVGRVEGLFLQLLDLGTVSERNEVYQVTTSWRASVLRVLRRHNILVS